MDIIQLLEVLKPVKNVVTVQIASNKDGWDSFIDLLKSVLPAAATAVVAWLAMNKSHRQFEKNAERQSIEFKLGIEQQTKTLKIQTQLATEVDLKKETCKGVRDACSHFLTSANQACLQSVAYKLAKSRAEYEDASTAHELFMVAMHEMATSKILLLSYLNPMFDNDFFESINNVNNFIQEDYERTGNAIAVCLNECRNFIMKKQQEIIDLTTSIAGRDSV